MRKGDTLFLYTDGLSETLDGAGSEYGIERLSGLLAENHGLSAKELISICVKETSVFRRRNPPTDDLAQLRHFWTILNSF
jgi:sigma-B regulation protein RsbU (phosphoserine phosphatase)